MSASLAPARASGEHSVTVHENVGKPGTLSGSAGTFAVRCDGEARKVKKKPFFFHAHGHSIFGFWVLVVAAMPEISFSLEFLFLSRFCDFIFAGSRKFCQCERYKGVTIASRRGHIEQLEVVALQFLP